MLTSKQRSYLSHLSNDLPDIIFVGKNGITNDLVNQVRDNLKARELVKGKVQLNSPIETRVVATKLAELTKSDVVKIIGRKFILYKKNIHKKKNVIPDKKLLKKKSKRISNRKYKK